uniref:Kielin/chordin-like protein n=1 Tax=Phallusia mammillata TaxID=59560 RepID=A0A6F9DEX4_9ASCI|nr:kielin/chordin-like protein [Phallusia mammillata]
MASKILFTESAEGVVSITNCTNCLFSIECSEFGCECNSLGADEVASNASAAENVTWWNTEDVEICCNSLSSTAATTLLADLLDYSYSQQLSLKKCHELVAPDETRWLTVYGLQELFATADRTSTYTSKIFDLRDDAEDFSDQSQEYRDYHVAFIQMNTLHGEVNMKSWSIVEELQHENQTQTLTDALARSPDIIRSKVDGTFMWTPIYGV